MRVWITGYGAVTALGSGTDRLLDDLCRKESGIRPLSHPALHDLPYGIGGEAIHFDPLSVKPKHEARHMDRFILLALDAAFQALEQAGYTPKDPALEPFGVYAGTALGGVRTLWEESLAFEEGRRMSPFLLPKFIPNMAAATLAIDLGCTGPNLTFTTACAASANSLGEAFHAIRSGQMSAAVVLGTESLFVPPVMASLNAAKALSNRRDDYSTASRPFSKDRDGMVMGEGAAALILESDAHLSARKSIPLGEIIGYGAGSDAHHPTAPHPEGDGAFRTMVAALKDAGIDPGAVGYVNAHGTSTQAGDRAEALAIKRIFGDRVPPVGSVKGSFGHTMGAAGAIEAIVSLEAMRRGILPPSVNCFDLDPEIDVPVIREPTKTKVDITLSNSFGFGGQNAAVVLKAVS